MSQVQRTYHQRTTLHRVPTHDIDQVFLVGILGEDRLTCIDDQALGLGLWKGPTGIGMCFLGTATVFFITLCVALLSSEAAQVIAIYTFPGTNPRAGAVIGLVLCVSVPVAVLALVMHRRRVVMRLIQQYPPAADGSPERA